jgi:hypothetical protein
MIRNLAHFDLGGIELELIEPRVDWPSIYLAALPKRDQEFALHHLGFMVHSDEQFDNALQTLMRISFLCLLQWTPLRFDWFTSTLSQINGYYSEIVFRRPKKKLSPVRTALAKSLSAEKEPLLAFRTCQKRFHGPLAHNYCNYDDDAQSRNLAAERDHISTGNPE